MADDSKAYILNVRIIRRDAHNRLFGQVINSPINDNPKHHVIVNYRQFMPKGYRLANDTTANYVVPIGKKGPELKYLRFEYVQKRSSKKGHKATKPKQSSVAQMMRKSQNDLDRAENALHRCNANLKRILSNRSSK